jgi:hypothetical protein
LDPTASTLSEYSRDVKRGGGKVRGETQYCAIRPRLVARGPRLVKLGLFRSSEDAELACFLHERKRSRAAANSTAKASSSAEPPSAGSAACRPPASRKRKAEEEADEAEEEEEEEGEEEEAEEAEERAPAQPLSADEARAAAAAEELELVPSPTRNTGFKGVTKKGGKYTAQVREEGKLRYLGMFATPVEAALHYSRHIGAERAAMEAARAAKKREDSVARDDDAPTSGASVAVASNSSADSAAGTSSAPAPQHTMSSQQRSTHQKAPLNKYTLVRLARG